MVDPRPINPNGKPFTWSYSAINDFDTCPYQYAAKRYYESVKFEHTEATLWGDRVHKANEARLKVGTPLPKDWNPSWEKYCMAMEQHAKNGARMYVEEELALDLSGNFVSWFAKEAWGRAKIDVTLIKDNVAHIYDWKTGKIRESLLQLELSAWFISQKFPEVDTFHTKFIWLNSLKTSGETFTRSQHMPGIEDRLHDKLSAMTKAWRTQIFHPKESGLCRGWCPVEECIFWKEKRR